MVINLALGVFLLGGVVGLVVLLWAADPAWTMTGALLLSVFSGKWNNFGLPSFVAPDRLLLLFAVVSVLLRFPGARSGPRVSFRMLHWPLLILAAYGIVSAAAAHTLFDHVGTFQLVDRLGLMPFLVFLVAPSVYHGPRQRTILLVGLVALGGYLALTAVFETTGPRQFVLPHYIEDPSYTQQLGRARGPFIQAAVNGMALFVCATACAAAWAASRRTWQRVVVAAIGFFCAASIVLTLERSVWIASVATTLILLLGVRQLRRFAVPVTGIAVVTVVVAIIAIPGLAGKVTARGGDQQTVFDRQAYNGAAIAMFSERPLVGWGYSTFIDIAPFHYSLGKTYPLTVHQGVPAHNVYASNLAELGAIGTILWLISLLCCVVLPIVRRAPPEALPWRLVAGATMLMWGIISALSPLSDVFPNLLLYLTAGVVLSFTPRSSVAALGTAR